MGARQDLWASLGRGLWLRPLVPTIMAHAASDQPLVVPQEDGHRGYEVYPSARRDDHAWPGGRGGVTLTAEGIGDGAPAALHARDKPTAR